ncbi:echinoderm microtubule-associated protein-like 6 [Diplonema papillatum]|nr:echinoderm microtubule-associated protein-like 6 [Diplonema papillatum]
MPYAEISTPVENEGGGFKSSSTNAGGATSSAEMYSLFESLNGELLRQKIMFESELRRQREAMDGHIAKVESELEQREVDCKSLQNSVTILGRSLDAITDALERVTPNLSAQGAVVSAVAKQPRGRSLPQRQPSPSRSQRGPSPAKTRAARPPSPDPGGKRSSTPRRDAGTQQDPYTTSRVKPNGAVVKQGGGPVPVILSGPKKIPAEYAPPGRMAMHKGATAVREVNADYIAGIRYPPFLQSSVFPPEGMEELQNRPSQLPSAKLELRHIHGCSVDGYNDNLWYCHDMIVTHAAAVGLVIDPCTNEQTFCFHHTCEITSIAVDPGHRLVATGQKAAFSGKSAIVAVWEMDTMTCRGSLKDFHDVSISCMAFSPDGTLLATVGGDEHHSFAVYRWETKELVAHCRLSTAPIYNIVFNPFQPRQCAVTGKRLVKFIDLARSTSPNSTNMMTLKVRSGLITQNDFHLSNQRVVCATFTAADVLITGTDSGCILVWENEKLVSILPDMHAGGVSAIKSVCMDGDTTDLVVCSGRDGVIRIWKGVESVNRMSATNSSSFDIASVLKSQHKTKTSSEHSMEEVLRLVTTGKAPVRSMALRMPPLSERSASGVRGLKVACSLFSNQIVEIDVDAVFNEGSEPLSVVLQAHSALPTASLQASVASEDVSFSNVVGGVASHPVYPVVATVGSDATLRCWNTLTNELKFTMPTPGRGICVDISPDGNMLAVGLEVGVTQNGKPCKGGGAVYSIAGTQSGDITSCKLVCKLEESEGDSAFCVRFDPSGQKLAVGGALNRLDIYDVAQGYRRVAATKGHNADVRHIDWSADGSLIQTDDRTPEHLYFSQDGSRVTRPAQIRSQRWGRWTCAYGWHVQGIWDERMDVSSVTSVDRSPDGDICAVGDAFGNVSLFTFPIPMPQASHKKYRGHSDEITSLAFGLTSNNVFSSSADGCLFHWNVVRQTS